MTDIIQIRDNLLKEIKLEDKNKERQMGYVDGVLDFYNELKKEIYKEQLMEKK